MLPEDQVVGKVDFTIFREYIELNGGIFRFAVLVSLAMFFWIASLTAASIIIERWCEDPEADQDYLYIYIALSILSNIFIFFRAYTLVLSGAKQGEKVHKSMMKSLLYASLGNFYNRIPIGRIINRLTKDLRQLDEEIGFAIGSVLVNFFSLLSTLTICIYSSTPLIFIPIVIVMFLSNKIRVYYLKTQREVSRL
jgi:ABC-type multidrug transport system fused ATPase/permease subunit